MESDSDLFANSKDLEQMVLSCMISSENNLKIAFEKDFLATKDFFYLEHQAVFRALQSLYANKKPPDLTFLAEAMKRVDALEKVGGIPYLVSLSTLAGTSAYFESYIQELKDNSARREFVNRCYEFRGLALSGEKTISSIASMAVENFGNIAKKTTPQKSLSLMEVSMGKDGVSFLEELRHKRKLCRELGTHKIPGISTGYMFLDEVLGGLREENFIIVAARPSVGKTAFALNLIRHLGFKQQIPIAFFSLEMSRNQIFLRLLSSQSGISAHKIETGQLSDSEMEQLETAINQLESSSIFINDACYESAKIISQMRILAEEQGVQAFFIDYIGLVEPSKSREIKAYEIGDITRSLKNVANELRLPIVCLAQLNRQADQTHRPQLSMLKDSGNLEQDADSVLFLHRRDLSDPMDKPDQIEIIVAKNRHGPTDAKAFQFKKEFGIIAEYRDNYSNSWG